jgi:DNA-directed RNA polymerase subunit RPC12/RpoP
MPTTGEKPGKGTYKCKKCGKVITLDNAEDKLPPCPVCNHTEWDKLA